MKSNNSGSSYGKSGSVNRPAAYITSAMMAVLPIIGSSCVEPEPGDYRGTGSQNQQNKSQKEIAVLNLVRDICINPPEFTKRDSGRNGVLYFGDGIDIKDASILFGGWTLGGGSEGTFINRNPENFSVVQYGGDKDNSLVFGYESGNGRETITIVNHDYMVTYRNEGNGMWERILIDTGGIREGMDLEDAPTQGSSMVRSGDIADYRSLVQDVMRRFPDK